MNKQKIIRLFTFFIGLSLMACTENNMAKKWGGNYDVHLPVNRKLETITWKENNLWVQTLEMKENEVPENHEFKERSSMGMFEGTITITESTDKKSRNTEISKQEIDCTKDEQEYCLGRCSDLAEITKNQCDYICGVGLGVGEKLRK